MISLTNKIDDDFNVFKIGYIKMSLQQNACCNIGSFVFRSLVLQKIQVLRFSIRYC